jgi:hypothetical protein
MYAKGPQLDPKCWSRSFGRMEHFNVGRYLRVQEKCDLFDVRCNLREGLQPFAADCGLEKGEPSKVSSGSC